MWLKACAEDGPGLKLQWGSYGGPLDEVYSIPIARLRAVSAEVCGRLEQLTKWSQAKDPAALPEILRGLADDGSRLRSVLFTPRERNFDIAPIEQWVADKYAAGDTTLWITADPDFHIPWGLVFDGDPTQIGESACSVADFMGFWSLKYTLSTVFTAYDPEDPRLRRKREEFRMISLLDRYEHESARQTLDPEHRAAFEQLLEYQPGKSFNLQGCRGRLAEAAHKDGLFYFFGHGKNGELLIAKDDGSQERIDSVEFERLMDRLTGRSRAYEGSLSLVFLNACESAAGDADRSLRRGASRHGLCGFIATEAEVPRAYAATFAFRFLAAMVDRGLSVGEAISELRCDPRMWPLSLLYGCYAKVGYRIVAATPSGAGSASIPSPLRDPVASLGAGI